MDGQKYTYRFVFTAANDCINESYFEITVPENMTEAKVRQIIANTHEKLSSNARQAMELAMKLDDELTDEERRYLEDADENNPYFGVPQTPDSLLKFIRKDYPDWSFKRVRNFFHMPSGDWGLATERQPQEDQNPLSVEKLGRF